VPQRWRAFYVVSAGINVATWISDFSGRVKALERYRPMLDGLFNLQGSSAIVTIASCSYWLGGMFIPESFITAIRQLTAQVNQWSLEDLELSLEIDHDHHDAKNNNIGIIIEGLVLEGASYNGKSQSIELSESLRCRLPLSRLCWRRKQNNDDKRLVFPLYLNDSRRVLVSNIYLDHTKNFSNLDIIPKYIWSQRGVAFIMQSFAV
jgi:hypothetical protein